MPSSDVLAKLPAMLLAITKTRIRIPPTTIQALPYLLTHCMHCQKVFFEVRSSQGGLRIYLVEGGIAELCCRFLEGEGVPPGCSILAHSCLLVTNKEFRAHDLPLISLAYRPLADLAFRGFLCMVCTTCSCARLFFSHHVAMGVNSLLTRIRQIRGYDPSLSPCCSWPLALAKSRRYLSAVRCSGDDTALLTPRARSAAHSSSVITNLRYSQM